ncbi:NUDIX hydrolase [Ornithinibacillus gellani]|uniref:NUDIX hydrolase n=1 Tax=Ornithinibacillus gellani TaxID=2293253 RepID=UPI000F481790|nr:NUDIX hydrolase [Ornithinibacillus gellani]TQS75072.1 NUDIX hydrolase [Ornithinibacillus gellani]
MEYWFGAAGICMNDHKEILMIKGFDSEGWAVPSGGIKEGESPQECCIREVKEETGYDVKVIEPLKRKETIIKGINVMTYYFKVEKIGGSIEINDLDGNIAEVEWKVFIGNKNN